MSTPLRAEGPGAAATAPAPDRLPPPLPDGPSVPWPYPAPAPDVAACDRAPKRPDPPSPLALLLDEACEWIDRLLILPSPHARDLLAMWAAATWARDKGVPVFSFLARLVILSDDPASAKSLALRTVIALSCKGRTFEDPSGPALLELISEHQITAGVDEFDVIIENSGGGGQQLRTILNGGVDPDGTVPRKGHTDTSSFGWVALCGLAQAYRSHYRLRALRSRGIPIEMSKATEQEQITAGIEEYDRLVHLPQLKRLGMAIGWHVGRNAQQLRRMERLATVPKGVHSRERDKWRPLLALGELAGPEWSKRATDACLWAVKGESDDDAPRLSPRQQIVTDMERVMMGEPFVRTLVLLQRLSDVGYPFVTGDPSTPVGAKLNQSAGAELSRALGGYVAPTKRRLDGRPVQGYVLDDVREYREAIVPALDDEDDGDDGQDVTPGALDGIAFEDVDPADALIA